MSRFDQSDAPKALRRLIFSVVALFVFWLAGLVWFAGKIPLAPEDTASRSDAIVVLTGGSGRLAEGLDLLGRGLAKKLFVSGVYQGVEVDELLRISRESPQDLLCCVSLGYDATDTSGNARESAQWMKKNGFESLRVVTASYHLPRSLLEFRRAMPEVLLIPHPVFPSAVHLENWWLWPGTAKLIIGEYMKYLASCAFYLLTGH